MGGGMPNSPHANNPKNPNKPNKTRLKKKTQWVSFLHKKPGFLPTMITLEGALFCIKTYSTALIAHYIGKSALLYLNSSKFISFKGRLFFSHRLFQWDLASFSLNNRDD